MDASAHPMLGELIDVGGHRLHLQCAGSGNPTVVLEPGLGEASSVMGWIAPAVAADGRVCVYDRAGRGWSDPADGPLDGAQTANDLHTLLDRAHVPGPYVLIPSVTKVNVVPPRIVYWQGGDHTGWDGVRDDFAGSYRVIVFDHRGTGQSDKPEAPPYTTRGFADDAVAILDHLSIARAHAYGVSMGGRIGQWLGIAHPDRLGALVLGCTTPGNAHGVRRSPEVDAALASPTATPEERFAALIHTLYSSAWVEAHPDFVAALRDRMAKPIPAYAERLHYLASEGHEAWDQLPTSAAPTLVIHGSDDRLNPTANAPLLAERIPGAELYIVQRGRHGYFEEFREEASRVVLGFLARHPLPVPSRS
jgi:pimeloyl-ACP methyl ester carboxylesterase